LKRADGPTNNDHLDVKSEEQVLVAGANQPVSWDQSLEDDTVTPGLAVSQIRSTERAGSALLIEVPGWWQQGYLVLSARLFQFLLSQELLALVHGSSKAG